MRTAPQTPKRSFPAEFPEMTRKRKAGPTLERRLGGSPVPPSSKMGNEGPDPIGTSEKFEAEAQILNCRYLRSGPDRVATEGRQMEHSDMTANLTIVLGDLTGWYARLVYRTIEPRPINLSACGRFAQPTGRSGSSLDRGVIPRNATGTVQFLGRRP